METRSSCDFSFYTSLGGKRLVRIPDPIDNITQPNALSAAARIVSANPFDGTVGSLVDVAGIMRVDTDRIILF